MGEARWGQHWAIAPAIGQINRLPPCLQRLGLIPRRRPVSGPRVGSFDQIKSGMRTNLLGHPVAGASWEGLVVENVVAALPVGGHASFYRTAAGAEIDLVLELGASEIWAIEIKRSSAPRPERGFFTSCADVGAARRLLVYPGAERFSLHGGVEAIPVRELVEDLSKFARAK